MKWIFILPLCFFLTACGFTTREVIEYQQVVVSPACHATPLVVGSVPPVDVSITNIDYY